MAADGVAKVAIGVFIACALVFFLRVQIALVKEFACSRRLKRRMYLPKFHRVTFHRSSFVVHERAELVVIAPDAKLHRISWRGRECAAAIALAAWQVGRHWGR